MPGAFYFFFSSRGRHTIYIGDWSSDVCSSDLSALAAQLRIRHVRDNPVSVKDVFVDAIANKHVTFRDSYDAGESEDAKQRVRVIIAHTLSTFAHLRVKVQKASAVGFASQDALAHKEQIVVSLSCARGEE